MEVVMGPIAQSTIGSLVANIFSGAVRWIKMKVGVGSVPQILSRTPPSADATSVIGRDEDLKKLWNALSKKKHVLLKGFGGIGKTRLAQMLFHKYKDRFDMVAWIRYQSDLKKSFFDSIDPKQVIVDGKNDKERWNAMVCALNNAGKKKLFIIDNVDSMGEQHPQSDVTLHELTGWTKTTVLLTSRVKCFEGYETYDLDYLSKEECSALFRYYYQGGNADPEMVSKLVELAGRHTLTIELLAKGAWQEEDLGEYYQKVKRGFEAVDEKFRTSHHHNEEDTIVDHLRYLYNMQSRNSNEVQVLQALAVLPINSECSKKELEDWFGLKKSDWTTLMHDGWLQYDKNKHRYSLHPLVRTIVRFDFEENGQKEKNICPGDIVCKLLDYLAGDDQWYDNSKKRYDSLWRMIGIAKSAISAVPPEKGELFGMLYLKLSWMFQDLGDYNRALEIGRKSLELMRKDLGEDHQDTAVCHINIGNVYLRLSDYKKALEYYEKALLIRKKDLGENHPDAAKTYNNLGSVYSGLGNYKLALEYHKKSLAIEKKNHGDEHIDFTPYYNNIGNAYYGLGDYDKALKCYEKALAIEIKDLGDEKPNISGSYNNIGALYVKLGYYDKALKCYEKALAIEVKDFGEDHLNTARSYNAIGFVYSGLGDYEKALENYEKALKIRKMLLDENHFDIAMSYHNIGVVYSVKKKYTKAMEYLMKALTIREEKLGENNPDTMATKMEIYLTKTAMYNDK